MPKTFTTRLLMPALIMITGCGDTKMTGGATERALCIEWGQSLPTRSHADSAQTADEIGEQYEVFAVSCPKFTNLIPKGGTT